VFSESEKIQHTRRQTRTLNKFKKELHVSVKVNTYNQAAHKHVDVLNLLKICAELNGASVYYILRSRVISFLGRRVLYSEIQSAFISEPVYSYVTF
jgi:hypothetical protein